MDKLDVILLMSVNPGFGGQSFIPGTLAKLRQVRRLIDESGRDIRLEIDGGVRVENIREIAAAGADMFVAGSAIFGKPDYKAVIDEMRAGAGPCPLNVPSISGAVRSRWHPDRQCPQLALAVNRTPADLGLARPTRPWCAPGSATVPTS